MNKFQRNPVEEPLRLDDARVGWITPKDSRSISAACDRWLKSRGVRVGEWSWNQKKKKN